MALDSDRNDVLPTQEIGSRPLSDRNQSELQLYYPPTKPAYQPRQLTTHNTLTTTTNNRQ